MRVALIVRTYLPHIGGIETLTADIASGLAKFGINVKIVTSRYDVSLPKQEQLGSITIQRFNIIKLTYLRSLFISPELLLNSDENFDIVHFISCYPNFFNLYGVYWYWLKGIPIVYTTVWPIPLTQKLYRSTLKRWLGYMYDMKLLKTLLSKADVIVTLTSGEANNYRKLLGADKNIQVIPECVSMPEKVSSAVVNDIVQKYNIKDGEHVLISVGRITPYKRIELIIYAFYLALKKLDNIKLFIIGPIENINYYARLMRLVRELNLRDRVFFTGRVSFSEREAFYSLSSIVLHASEYEAFVRPALEGWRFARPIITFNLSPASDFIEEEKGGIITKRWGDVFEMANSIVKILKSGEYLELGKNGYNSLLKKYTIDKVAEKYLAVYKELLR